MGAFIKYSTAISPQASISEEFLWNEVQVYENKLNCIEPVYKDYFPPMQIRRMSRLVKMALTTAKICVDKASVDMLDAIITASGWGCLNDTYKYLGEISSEENSVPSPATFIQSTHNTPGGQIALTLGCQNYNNVFVNGNTSFEMGLIDTMMLLNEGKNNVLLGGFDEIADTDYLLKKEAGYWKEDGLNNSNFVEHDSEGTLPGEGSSFFLISSDRKNGKSEIKNCSVLHCSPDYEIVQIELLKWLKNYNLGLTDMDVVLFGANGNSRIMPLYNDLSENVFSDSLLINYKTLCGEYDTSSAFALWLADRIIQNKSVPKYMSKNKSDKKVENILIYNYAGGDKHAVILVSKTNS